MIRYICKEISVCPEGAWTGQTYHTFTDPKELENWLRENTGYYRIRTLVGCELKKKDEDENNQSDTYDPARIIKNQRP